MSLAQMNQNAEAKIAANAAQAEAVQAQQQELAEREAVRNSAEVQALNDIAQVEIYGDRVQAGESSSDNSRKNGLLSELSESRRYGDTEEDRAASVSEYEKDLEGLIEDDFELTQAKFLLDLKLEDNVKRAKLIAKQLKDGKPIKEAESKGFEVYDTKDQKRREIVKENQLFTREAYEDFLKSKKADAVETSAAKEQEKLEAEKKAEEARAAIEAAAAAEPTSADAEASEPSVEPEAKPAAEADTTAENAVLDALKEVCTGESLGKDVSEMFKKAKELIEGGADAQEVAQAFREAAAAGIDALIEEQVEKDTLANRQRPTDEAIAEKRQQFEDDLINAIIADPEADDTDSEDEPEPEPSLEDETDEADEVEETDDTDEVEDDDIEDKPEDDPADDPSDPDDTPDTPAPTTTKKEVVPPTREELEAGVAESKAIKAQREKDTEDLILQMPGNREEGIFKFITRGRRTKLNKRAADLDTGTGENMYVTKDGRITDIPATVDIATLTRRQRKAIKIDPKTNLPVTTLDVKTNRAQNLVAPVTEPKYAITRAIKEAVSKKFDPSDAAAVAALPVNIQDALSRRKASLGAATIGTEEYANELLAFKSLIANIADDYGKRF